MRAVSCVRNVEGVQISSLVYRVQAKHARCRHAVASFPRTLPILRVNRGSCARCGSNRPRISSARCRLAIPRIWRPHFTSSPILPSTIQHTPSRISSYHQLPTRPILCQRAELAHAGTPTLLATCPLHLLRRHLQSLATQRTPPLRTSTAPRLAAPQKPSTSIKDIDTAISPELHHRIHRLEKGASPAPFATMSANTFLDPSLHDQDATEIKHQPPPPGLDGYYHAPMPHHQPQPQPHPQPQQQQPQQQQPQQQQQQQQQQHQQQVMNVPAAVQEGAMPPQSDVDEFLRKKRKAREHKACYPCRQRKVKYVLSSRLSSGTCKFPIAKPSISPREAMVHLREKASDSNL
jgi:DNA segregation ATPase FtsK/SpoIIIE-like protein